MSESLQGGNNVAGDPPSPPDPPTPTPPTDGGEDANATAAPPSCDDARVDALAWKNRPQNPQPVDIFFTTSPEFDKDENGQALPPTLFKGQIVDFSFLNVGPQSDAMIVGVEGERIGPQPNPQPRGHGVSLDVAARLRNVEDALFEQYCRESLHNTNRDNFLAWSQVRDGISANRANKGLHGSGDAVDLNGAAAPFMPIRGRSSNAAAGDPPLAQFVFGGERENVGSELSHLANIWEPFFAVMDRASQMFCARAADVTPRVHGQGRETFEKSPTRPRDPNSKKLPDKDPAQKARLDPHAAKAGETYDAYQIAHWCLRGYFDFAYGRGGAPIADTVGAHSSVAFERFRDALVNDFGVTTHTDASLALDKEIVAAVATGNPSPGREVRPVPIATKCRLSGTPDKLRDVFVRDRTTFSLRDIVDGSKRGNDLLMRTLYAQVLHDHEIFKLGLVSGNVAIQGEPKAKGAIIVPCVDEGDGRVATTKNMIFSSSRDPCLGFLNIGRDVVVEMVREGFSWLGGVRPQFDFSGDMMHFDLRRHTGSAKLDAFRDDVERKKAIRAAIERAKKSLAAAQKSLKEARGIADATLREILDPSGAAPHGVRPDAEHAKTDAASAGDGPLEAVAAKILSACDTVVSADNIAAATGAPASAGAVAVQKAERALTDAEAASTRADADAAAKKAADAASVVVKAKSAAAEAKVAADLLKAVATQTKGAAAKASKSGKPADAKTTAHLASLAAAAEKKSSDSETSANSANEGAQAL